MLILAMVVMYRHSSNLEATRAIPADSHSTKDRPRKRTTDSETNFNLKQLK